ncbi:COG3650 family protein [Mameliella sediminis]|uniref:COG3650 family protein n=1 Tax=Mameliella sediminis TaxID=2836866 RepID=UPI001C474116|nr:SH3 domain-containing protein [Mameliella sediminis]MBY6113786.1 SH3 domain-containing protein [Antarctobacter heliothermus]MBY6142866.1 SH3 domain-containing protein [Mameliella alba]MBV7395083.1 SH3 domain-containing protein [Mameliella sediminis]MBY6159721.1 SH3 domain-containing protein [Mameliella alba]MBY6168192.1 SH3 domain-containing protein [Mameliella alba]
MNRFAAILICLAGAASAQDFPALYNVTGVDDGDVLNMRTRPTENGTVIGALAFDAKLVEVIEEDDGWGRVNVEGLSGWVPLTSMERLDGTQMPAGYQFKCFGTEPFWSATVIQGDKMTFTRPDDDDKAFTVGELTTAVSRDHPHALQGSKLGENVSLVVTHEICTDGMSDYRFGFSGTVVIGGYDTQVYTGCCSLDMN